MRCSAYLLECLVIAGGGVRNVKWVALAIVALAGFGFLLTAHPEGRSATLSWDYDYSKDPPCDASVKGKPLESKCVLGFKAFIRKNRERFEEQFRPNHFDSSGKVVSKAITLQLPVHQYGRLEFCVTSVGKDENGRPLESYLTCTKRWVVPLLKDNH